MMSRLLTLVLVLGFSTAASAANWFHQGWAYEYYTRVSVYENNLATFSISNGMMDIRRFAIATGDRCRISTRDYPVAAYSSRELANVELVDIQALPDRGSAYVYSVNQDLGAKLSTVQFYLLPVGRTGWFVSDACPIQLWLSF